MFIKAVTDKGDKVTLNSNYIVEVAETVGKKAKVYIDNSAAGGRYSDVTYVLTERYDDFIIKLTGE